MINSKSANTRTRAANLNEKELTFYGTIFVSFIFQNRFQKSALGLGSAATRFTLEGREQFVRHDARKIGKYRTDLELAQNRFMKLVFGLRNHLWTGSGNTKIQEESCGTLK